MSTYSEFMGLYPPTNQSTQLSVNELNSLNEDLGMPAIKVRNAPAHKAEAK